MIIANWLGSVFGGLILGLQEIDPSKAASPVSPIMVAILIGLLIRNLVGVPDLYKPGIAFAMRFLLRLGIIGLGIRLSIYDALRVGVWGIPVVAMTIGTGLLFTIWFNRRMQQPERLGILIAASTSICGVTAIISTAAAIGASDEETAYSVATVTMFGLMAMLVYPYLAHWLFAGDPMKAGVFMGTAIHDTSQVAGAAVIYGQVWSAPGATNVATIIKLLRNVFLVVVVPLLSLLYVRLADNKAMAAGPKRVSFTQAFPVFILGFLAMAGIRSLGDASLNLGSAGLGLFTATTWKSLCSTISKVGSDYLLGAAMAGVGLNTSFSIFRGVGWKPMLVGLIAALVVGAVGMVAGFLFGPMIG